MQLPVRGHPLHTRSLTLVVSTREDGRWHARGDVIDLRKVGFVPLLADIQPAGIIHQMSIDLVVDPEAARIDAIEVAQPVVAIEPSAYSGGECCRDPAPRLQALVGETLDGGFASRLSRSFGGALGCSHLLSLFQLMSTGIRRAILLEAGLSEGTPAREAGDRLLRRAVFVEGFAGEDDCIEMTVQLADFHTRPQRAAAMSVARLAGEWDVRLFARCTRPAHTLSGLRVAERERCAETLGSAVWREQSDRVACLEGAPVVGGLARRLFQVFDGPDDGLLLDASLQLAPGYVQVMAAVVDTWLESSDGSRPSGPPPGAVGGLPNSCYMWREGGRLLQVRGASKPGEGGVQ